GACDPQRGEQHAPRRRRLSERGSGDPGANRNPGVPAEASQRGAASAQARPCTGRGRAEGCVRKRGLQFWIGVSFMATSFALYPAYALIAFLPISPTSKIACGLAGWMFSWSLFALGSALAGKE